MQLIPAIDIREGRCVRLLHGDFGKVTHYDFDPRELARKYRDQGAEWLHVVDLDGAQSGQPMNADLIREIAGTTSLRIQIGGGIRSRHDLVAVLDYADRAVIGSLAATAPALVVDWLREFGPERITLGLDVRLDNAGEPQVTTHGWTRAAGLGLADAIAGFQVAGLRHVLCTDVARDGALAGPNFTLYESCVKAWPDLEFQASGGVSSAADLARLAVIGVAAAISGKALLDDLIQPEELSPFLPNA
jgi:phosphoribosylformimino-5-aminoimidazole carboxamide ribotide isomerase